MFIRFSLCKQSQAQWAELQETWSQQVQFQFTLQFTQTETNKTRIVEQYGLKYVPLESEF